MWVSPQLSCLPTAKTKTTVFWQVLSGEHNTRAFNIFSSPSPAVDLQSHCVARFLNTSLSQHELSHTRTTDFRFAGVAVVWYVIFLFISQAGKGGWLKQNKTLGVGVIYSLPTTHNNALGCWNIGWGDWKWKEGRSEGVEVIFVPV